MAMIQLRLSYLNTILDNISDTILLISVEPAEDYVVLFVNKTYAGSTASDERDVVGKNIKDLVDNYGDLHARYKKVKKTKKPLTWRAWYDLPTGHRLLRTKLIPVLDEADECVQIITISSDITPDDSWTSEFDAIV